MAQYTKAQVTQLGHNLNAKVLGNEPHVLEFTRIVTSDTDYSSNDLVLMEGITNIRQTGSLSGTVVQDDQFNVKGTFDTADIESGYYMRTIALFANDPDKGEILYAVVACDPADYIHSRGDVGDSIIHFDFAIKVTGAQNVTITIPTTGLITVHEINDIRDDLDNKFEGLEDETNNNFSSLSADIDQRFQTKTNELNTSFTNLSNNLSTQVDNKIDELEDGFGVFKTATQSEINAFKTAAQADIDSKTAAMQSTVTSSIDSMNSQMDTHTTNVNNLISEGEDLYEDMRDQSAELDTKFTNKSSELDTKFNTLEDTYDARVTTLEGETSALETGLSNLDSKVDQEVSTIDERVDTLQSELTQAVQGGGRNLVLNSLKLTTEGSSTSGITRSLDENGDVVVHSSISNGYVSHFGMTESRSHVYAHIENGDHVTFSIDVKAVGHTQKPTFYFGSRQLGGYNNLHGELIEGEWCRLHATIVWNGEGTWSPHFTVYGEGSEHTFRRAKLELGTIPTAYTRAPEDIEAEIAAAQDGADQANTIIGSGFFSESGATPSTTFPVTIEPTNEVQTFEIPLTTQWVAGKRYRIELEGDFPYETKLTLHPANLEGGNEFYVVSGSFQKYVDVTTLQNTQSPKMVFTIDSTPATPEEGEPEPNTRATRINSINVVYLEGETLTQRSIRHQNEIKALESAVPTKLDKSAVTNNLTSTSTTNALSAAQGKALQDNKLDKSAVTNSLTSTSTTNALSAAQGKALADGKVDKSQLSTSGTANTVVQRDASGNINVGGNLTVTGSVSASTPMTHVYGQTLAGNLQLRTVANAKADLGITALEGSTVKRSDIVNTLTSTSTSAPLSAAQGKALQDGKLDKSDVLNTLTSSSVTHALSANQGRLLNNAVNAKMDANATVDSLASTSATLPLSAKQGKALQDNKVEVADIVNNLTTTSTNKPLSAAQGRLLNLSKLDKSAVTNNLTSTSTTNALSAAQGRVLDAKINLKADANSVYTKTETDTLLDEKAGVTELNELTQTVQGGGRNLLLDSNSLTLNKGTRVNEFGHSSLKVPFPAVSVYTYPQEEYSEEVIAGQDYVFSATVLFTGTKPSNVRFSLGSFLGGNQYVSGFDELDEGQWGRVWFTRKATNAGTPRFWVFSEGSTEGFLYLRDFKLEEGTLPTTYTRAPEDIEAGLANRYTKDETDLLHAELMVAAQVGGQNLLLNSLNLTLAGRDYDGITKSLDENGDVVVHSTVGSGYARDLGLDESREHILAHVEHGDYVTFSVDIKAVGNTQNPLFVFGDNQGNFHELQGELIEGEWCRLHATISWNGVGGWNPLFLVYGNGSEHTFRRAKLELGKIPTPYSRAPKDMDNEVKTLEERIKSLEEAVFSK